MVVVRCIQSPSPNTLLRGHYSSSSSSLCALRFECPSRAIGSIHPHTATHNALLLHASTFMPLIRPRSAMTLLRGMSGVTCIKIPYTYRGRVTKRGSSNGQGSCIPSCPRFHDSGKKGHNAGGNTTESCILKPTSTNKASSTANFMPVRHFFLRGLLRLPRIRLAAPSMRLVHLQTAACLFRVPTSYSSASRC